MKDLKPLVAIIFLCVVATIGCNESDAVVGLQYSPYKEGPHVILRDGFANVVYFTKVDRIWTMDNKFLAGPDSAVIQVDNPVFDPFDVCLDFSKSPVASDYPPASKIIVIADIEGNFAGFYSLLVAQNVIDINGNWIYGDGHLVMLGDLFDRGADVTPIFWLLYKLESEALAAGGIVHTLLGNHEIMNFNGDLRYLHKKYEAQVKDTGFEYPELYNMKTVLGQWLRQKPAIIKIGNAIFSHAGISPEVLALDMTLQEINDEVLEHNFHSSNVLPSSQSETIFGTNGIFWYRGWVDDPRSTDILDRILETYHADHMIIGHTIVKEIRASFDFKLIAMDLHQPKISNKRTVRALCIEGNNFYDINNRGMRIPIKSD